MSDRTHIPLAPRVVRRTKRINRRLYVELNHDPANSLLIVGSGRSGTTWLAELFARPLSRRLIFEPFHPHWTPVGDRLRLFLAPDEDAAEFRDGMNAVFSGRLHTRQLDRPHPVRFARGRVVKDIHVMNELPWIRANFPNLPIALMLRHPLAVAGSRQRADARSADAFYGLGRYLSTPMGQLDVQSSPAAGLADKYMEYRRGSDRLAGFVAEWCVENALAVSTAIDANVRVLHYENLVRDPVETLAALATDLGVDARRVASADAARPSSTDWFARGTPTERENLLGSWRDEMSAATVRRGLDVLRDFGIDHLYGEDPLPLAGAMRP